jgi:hypothetical protein
MSRGALYITWPGEGRVPALLERSIASLKAVHPELPVHVAELPEGSGLLDKARMYDLSPFDQTLFLDADTVVLDRLDYGFDRASRHGIAVCICECPWARRYQGFEADAVEYNTGVLFFDKGWFTGLSDYYNSGVDDVFRAWKKHVGMDSSSRFVGADGVKTQAVNDQAGFARAIETSYWYFNPFVLPLNWNFRHRWQKTVFGPVKIWHDYDDVPEAVVRWNAAQTKPDAVIQCGRVA